MDWFNVQPSLLDRSLKSHGPLLMQAMMAEQFSSTTTTQSAPQSSFLVEDSTSLQGSLLNFIAKNGLHLFSGSGQKLTDQACPGNCDTDFAHLPALNHFLYPTAPVLKRKFFEDVRPGDVIVVKVTNVETTGLGCLVMCLEGEFELDIYDLDLAVFVDQEELLPPDWDPVKYFNIVRHYSRKDVVRVQVATIDSERRKLTVLLKNAKNCAGIKMGKISETELPAYFRASFELDGKTRTYNELLVRSEGWRNLACLDNLARRLGVGEASTGEQQAVSFLTEIKSVNFAQSEFGATLRKNQSRRLALRSVRRGVEELRGGKSMEAMQHFNKALQVDEDNVEALVGRGALHANGGAYVLALEDFDKALRVDPTHANAKKYAVETLLNQAQKYRDDYVNKDPNKLQKLLIAVYCRALSMDPACGEARQELMKYGTLSDASPPSPAALADSQEAGAVECIPLPPESQSAQNFIEIGEARQPVSAGKPNSASFVKNKATDDNVSPTQPGGDIMQRLQAYHQQIQMSGMDISIDEEEIDNSSGNSGEKGGGGRPARGAVEGKRKSEKDESERWSVDAGISKSRKPAATGISPESVSPTSAGNSSSSSSLVTNEKNNMIRKRKKSSSDEESNPGPSVSGSLKKHTMKDMHGGRKSAKNFCGGNKPSGMDRQISVTSTVKNEIDSSSSSSSNESRAGNEGKDSDTSTDSSSSTSDTSNNGASVRRKNVTKKKIKQSSSSSSSDGSNSDSDSSSSSTSSRSDSSSTVKRTASRSKSKKLTAKSSEKQTKKVELMKLAKKLQSSDPNKVREMYRSLGLQGKAANKIGSKMIHEESLKRVPKRKVSIVKPDPNYNSKISFARKSGEIEYGKKSNRLSLEENSSDRSFDKITSAPDFSVKTGTSRKSVGDLPLPSSSSGKKKPKKQLDPNVAKKLKTLESFMNDLKTKDAEHRHRGSSFLVERF